MTYVVKELFYTLQGEGVHHGRPAVFCRFAGCNLWTGLEKDRATAVCTFCDTQFRYEPGDTDGGKFLTAAQLADAINAKWPALRLSDPWSQKFVVFTGGEPLLQVDTDLLRALHDHGFYIAVETNGTQRRPGGYYVDDNIDWVCVSPKANAELVLDHGDELKLVYPQPLAMPERFAELDFDHFWLQPMDGPKLEENIQAAIAYCLEHPQWQLSLQTHKLVGLP